MFKRSSGILFHPTSLPGKYGIGTLGKKAFEFVDFLAKAKQQLWQIFPLGPTGYGDSPYQSFSTFAGNPYLIDFDLLIEGNLLQQSDLEGINFGNNEECIDYGLIYNEKYPLLRKAYENFKKLEDNPYTQNYNDFKWCNGWWLEDYAMYIALKNHFNGLPWNEWPADIKARNHDAMEKYRWEIGDDIEFHRFIQFLFFTQWNDVKEYANNKDKSVAEHIFFEGSRHNIEDYYKSAVIFIQSSSYEGLPTTIIEALQSGIPVVASDCHTGPREILGDNEYGLLCKVEDAKDMAKKIYQMVTDKELANHYIKVGKQRGNDFSPEVIKGQLENILKKFED